MLKTHLQLSLFVAVFFASCALAATTRPAAPSKDATALAVALYPTSQRPPTTAPAVRIPGPFLPAPDARLRPRATTLPAIPEPTATTIDTPPLLTFAAPQPPKFPAHRALAVPPIPFPPLALPSPPVTSATGASSAASAMNMPPIMRPDGSGFFPLLPPLTRPTEAADPDPLAPEGLSPTPVPDEDPPSRALHLLPKSSPDRLKGL